MACDLIPLVSWLALRGRCRTCSVAIGLRQPMVELAGAVWGAVALFLLPGWGGLGAALFGWQLLALSLCDLEHFRLPRGQTLTLMLTGLGSAALLGTPDLMDRLLGGLAGFAALALIAWLYRVVRGRAGLGAGDAHLLGGIGCWLGWQALPLCLLFASLSGLAVALALKVAGRPVNGRTKLPFGPMLSAGALWVWVVALQG
jgi:leader peptidase (prepilin peptidase)/N-methyltransferase